MLRVEIITKRLAQIAAMTKDELEDEINRSFAKHKLKYNSLVNWDSLKLTQKRLA